MIEYYKDEEANIEYWFDTNEVSLKEFIRGPNRNLYLHREDGPARIDLESGIVSFYLNGCHMIPSEWLERVNLTDEEKIAIKLEYSDRTTKPFVVPYITVAIRDSNPPVVIDTNIDFTK